MKYIFKKLISLPLFLFIIIILSFYNSQKVEATVVPVNVYARIAPTPAIPNATAVNPLTVIGTQSIEISFIPNGNATKCILSSPNNSNLRNKTGALTINTKYAFNPISVSKTTTFAVNCVYVPPVIYAWQTGAWGVCTGTPGTTGTQSRTVSCVSSVGQIVNDNKCTTAKPTPTSQTCTVPTTNSCVGTYQTSTKVDWNGNNFNWISGFQYEGGLDQGFGCYDYLFTTTGGNWSYETQTLYPYGGPGGGSASGYDPTCYPDGNTINTTSPSYSYTTAQCSSATDAQGNLISKTTCNYDFYYSGCSWSAPTPVNGLCNNTVNNGCYYGNLNDTVDNSTNYLWQCSGINGGSTSSCSLAKPKLINGSCNNTVNNGCYTGALNNTLDSSTNYLWQCLGLNGGSTSSCSLAKPGKGKLLY